jgi:hypothetical protein
MNKYQKWLGKVPTYLAPEELRLLKTDSVDSCNMTEAAEMFSIGLTILSTVNLQ